MRQKYLGIAFLIGTFLFFVVTANCQKVEVDQSFVDSATKAFEEVVALRDAVEKFQTERSKTQAERDAAQTLINSFDALIKVKDQLSAEKDKIIALYERVIQMQTALIEQLEKKLLRPRSFMEKFLKTLKELALFAGGILIGRAGL